MLNPRTYLNSRPDGYGVLEIVNEPEGNQNSPRRFVPLRRTDLTGEVTGPLANLRLTQTFHLDAGSSDRVIEAAYRFPLPGDAAVTGVRVRFEDVEIHTALKERTVAETEYATAKKEGRQAALVTRESPDVFTLSITGIKAGQEIVVQTDYVQLSRPEGSGWSLRIPLTTAPRYVRADEVNSRHAAGQPLALLRDPGHRFALDVTLSHADRIASPTHQLAVTPEQTAQRVRPQTGEVIPDRDCVLTWRSTAVAERPSLQVWTHSDPQSDRAYFLALCSPPTTQRVQPVPREVILLVDHSGSMQGPKWEAADWAVERFLAGLTERDSFALGLFHDTTRWFAPEPRQATPEAVRSAVAFLRENRDQGGTNLGVALEQALDQPRIKNAPARHVLVITDAEVSDSGRLLRLADREAERPERRRVSVLCIDAAPNAGLADELAGRGGGVARYLTSDPAEDDVTTALDEVLADWAAPVVTGLKLEVNRTGVEAAGRAVALVVPGPASAVDLGDLPAGRPVWVVGRAPLGAGEPLTFALNAAGSEVIATQRGEATGAARGVKALFGADRIRRLEYLAHSGLTGDDLAAELARLGVDVASTGEAKVYAENAREAGAKQIRAILVRESLESGLPSAETAFVAVRSETGQPVTETVVVANALPAGWSESFASAPQYTLGARGGAAGVAMRMMAAPPTSRGRDSRRSASSPSPAPMALPDIVARLQSLADRGSPSFAAPAAPASMPAPAASKAKIASGNEVKIAISADRHSSGDGAVLFDSGTDAGATPLPEPCHLTSLSVVFGDPTVVADTLEQGLTLLVFVGDLAAPRARVRLVDVIRQGGRRPLNLRWEAGQIVRLVLEDPAGTWKGGVPAMEIALGWKA